MEKQKVYSVGTKVPESGYYICVPCGYKKHFKKGATFPQCFGCLKGEKYDGDDYFKNLGTWEPLKN